MNFALRSRTARYPVIRVEARPGVDFPFWSQRRGTIKCKHEEAARCKARPFLLRFLNSVSVEIASNLLYRAQILLTMLSVQLRRMSRIGIGLRSSERAAEIRQPGELSGGGVRNCDWGCGCGQTGSFHQQNPLSNAHDELRHSLPVLRHYASFSSVRKTTQPSTV